jgi:3-oxoacyl-[acyl-carrier protein] reductase
MKRLDDRVAVVTGAATGIGRGIAAVLAAEGAKVAVADLDDAGAAQTAASLRETGTQAIDVVVDVASRASVDEMAAAVIDRFGRIDILAANAGVYQWDEIVAISDEIWDRINSINLKGALYCIQAVLPGMRERGYGRIVLTSSITGAIVAAPGLAHYAATKAGQLGLMRAAAFETVNQGITVNAVQPGNVRTAGMESMEPALLAQVEKAIPIGRLAEPEEVGWAVRFLASEEAAYITGQTLVIDGGQVLPEVRG